METSGTATRDISEIEFKHYCPPAGNSEVLQAHKNYGDRETRMPSRNVLKENKPGDINIVLVDLPN